MAVLGVVMERCGVGVEGCWVGMEGCGWAWRGVECYMYKKKDQFKIICDYIEGSRPVRETENLFSKKATLKAKDRNQSLLCNLTSVKQSSVILTSG